MQESRNGKSSLNIVNAEYEAGGGGGGGSTRAESPPFQQAGHGSSTWATQQGAKPDPGARPDLTELS